MPESSRPSRMPKPPVTESKSPGRKPVVEPIRAPTGFSQRFVDVLGWVITAAWALSMIVHAANIGYEPPVSIHALMTIVAGAAFSTNLIKAKNGE